MSIEGLYMAVWSLFRSWWKKASGSRLKVNWSHWQLIIGNLCTDENEKEKENENENGNGYRFEDINLAEESKQGIVVYCYYTFFCRQLDFSSEPGVANEILENEPKSCLTVVLKEKVQSELWQLLRNCLIFGQNPRHKAKQPSCL